MKVYVNDNDEICTFFARENEDALFAESGITAEVTHIDNAELEDDEIDFINCKVKNKKVKVAKKRRVKPKDF